MNIDDLDLNLLPVLDALLRERSVSRAAVRLRKSQPAVSNALGRLRRELGDPLLVRGQRGMVPTPRALALAAPLEQALTQVRTAIRGLPSFDPRQAERTFVIAASDHAQLLILPPLAQRLAEWPGVRLRIVPLPDEFPALALERGELDLVLGVFDLAPGDVTPTGLKRQLLMKERLVAVGRKGNRALGEELATAAKRPQLGIAPRGGTRGRFEAAGQLRVARNVVLYLPHYLAAPFILSTTELVAVLPERLAAALSATFPLERAPLERLKSTLNLHQVWHPRADLNPGHIWLRQEVAGAAKTSTPQSLESPYEKPPD